MRSMWIASTLADPAQICTVYTGLVRGLEWRTKRVDLLLSPRADCRSTIWQLSLTDLASLPNLISPYRVRRCRFKENA